MRKAEAIKKAAALGYTIKFRESPSEIMMRKPGAAMNTLNRPREFAFLERRSRRWFLEEKIDPAW